MPVEYFAKSIGSASELLLSVPVKQGFIPHRKTITYATRLRSFLRLASALRSRGTNGVERGTYVAPIDRLRTLHYARWTMSPDDKFILLAVVFDHPNEPYLRFIVDEAGPLLDTILCHAPDYHDNATDVGYAAFARYAEEHRWDVDSFTGTHPEITADDINYLRGFEVMQRTTDSPTEFDELAAQYTLLTPAQKADRLRSDPEMVDAYNLQSLRVLRAMHYNSDLFPEPNYAFPGDQQTAELRDHLFYKRFARALVEGLRLKDFTPRSPILEPFKPALDWAGDFTDPDIPNDEEPTGDPIPPAVRSDFQGGIAESYKTSDGKMMNAGLMVLLKFANNNLGGTFLKNLLPKITKADAGNGSVPRVNIALTHQGLKTLSLPDKERLLFPHVFREGIEARAGMLGDVGQNSPRLWQLKGLDGTRPPLHTDTVDAILQIQTRLPRNQFLNAHEWSEDHPMLPDLHTAFGGTIDDVRKDGVEIISIEPMVRHENDQGKMEGHFGFVDGISQPKLGGRGPHRIPLGNMILGEPQDDDSVEISDLQQNGTFLVVRKLEQKVFAFRDLKDDELKHKMVGRKFDGTPLTDHQSENDFDYSNDQQGRKCPLNAHIRRANPRFRQSYDPNTRIHIHHDAPRIMRRGFSYGPKAPVDADPDDIERGMIFICYNASIAEQFEVIQRWLGGGSSTGLNSAQNDPVLGPIPKTKQVMFQHDPARPNDPPRWASVQPKNVMRYVDQNGDPKREDLGSEQFVQVKWGFYLFVPSISNLTKIANHAVDGRALGSDRDAMVERGREVFFSLKNEDDWKWLLEDIDPRVRDKADDVIAYLQDVHGGYYDSDKRVENDARKREGKEPLPDVNLDFVLVTDPDKVMEVLRKDKDFSVRGYWKRMKPIVGVAYLGEDPDVQPMYQFTDDPKDEDYEANATGKYNEIAPLVNPFLASLNDLNLQKPEFTRIFSVTSALLRNPQANPAPEVDPETGGHRKLIDMEELIGVSTSMFGLDWMGIPRKKLEFEDGAEEANKSPHKFDFYPYDLTKNTPKSPNDFIETATHIYGPWNKADDEARAKILGKRMYDTLFAWLKANPNARPDPQRHLTGFLRAEFGRMPNEQIASIAVNAAIGLHTPITTSFAGIAYDWIKEGTYWRLQEEFMNAWSGNADEAIDVADEILRGPMLESLAKFASPEHLYRVTATQNAEIAGESIAFNKKVVVALGPAAQHDLARNEEITFGGYYDPAGKDVPVHACPGRGAGMMVMLATMAGLMAAGQVVENSPLTMYLRLPEQSA